MRILASGVITCLKFQDEYKDDSIGSAGSLANRSNKSQERRQRQQIWEEEEDELSGEESVTKTIILISMMFQTICLMTRVTTPASTCSSLLTASWTGRGS